MKEVVEDKFKEIFGIEGKIKTYFVCEKISLKDDENNKELCNEKTNGIYATVREREDRNLNFYFINFSEIGIISFSIDNIANNENECWIKYPKELILRLKNQGYNLDHGFDIVYYSEIKEESGNKLAEILKKITANVIEDMFNLNIDNHNIVEENEADTETTDMDSNTTMNLGEKLRIYE